MADIKLIATDLDGTFLQEGDTPHPESIRAVKRCHEAGIKVCAFTGRNWSWTKRIYQQAGFDRFCVLCNGSAIYDAEEREMRYRNRFDPASIERIIRVIQKYPKADYWLTGFDHISMLKSHGAPWYTHMDEEEQKRKDVYFYRDADALIDAVKEDVMRINWRLPYDEYAEQVLADISEFTDIEIVPAEEHTLEITHKDSNKSEGLMVLSDIYEIAPENIMAIGDSCNDAMMLAWAGTGVAMGNADERLKAVADYVTDINTRAGMAKAVDQIALGKKRMSGDRAAFGGGSKDA